MRDKFCFVLLLAISSSLVSCERVYSGEQLSVETLRRLQTLHLLNSDEKIYQFYTNVPNGAAGAGNFYTTQRIAHYWLDSDKRKNAVDFSYYQDIIRIDTVYLDKTLTYISYMTVTKKDGSHFQVYVGGKKPVVSAFFEHAMAHWKAASCLSR